jgi:hypothetical protein
MTTVVLATEATVPLPSWRLAAFVLDWRHDPLWRAQVRSFTVTPLGRSVAGQELVEELRFAGLTFRTTTVVDRAEPLRASYAGASRQVRVRGSREVTALGDRESRVALRTEIELLGAMRPLTPLLAPSYRRTDESDARRLPAVAERWARGLLEVG